MNIAFSLGELSHFICMLIKCLLFSFHSTIQSIMRLLYFSHNKKFKLKTIYLVCYLKDALPSPITLKVIFIFILYSFNVLYIILDIIFHFMILKIISFLLNLVFSRYGLYFLNALLVLGSTLLFWIARFPLACFMSAVYVHGTTYTTVCKVSTGAHGQPRTRGLGTGTVLTHFSVSRSPCSGGPFPVPDQRSRTLSTFPQANVSFACYLVS